MQSKTLPRVRQICLCGILIALGFAFSYLEHLIPLQWLIPIPGVKLGLANLVSLFAVYSLNIWQSVGIVFGRCMMQAILFGTISSFLFSITGGILAYFMMYFLHRVFTEQVSIFGISIAGAALHHIGQICCAVFYFHSTAFIPYLGYLLLLSIPIGFLTGLIGSTVIFRIIDYRT